MLFYMKMGRKPVLELDSACLCVLLWPRPCACFYSERLLRKRSGDFSQLSSDFLSLRASVVVPIKMAAASLSDGQ